MNPKLTQHAKTRFRQRGIKNSVIDYLIQFGDTKHAPGGALKISLTKRNKTELISALKKEMQRIERTSGVIIVQKDGQILTGYHRN